MLILPMDLLARRQENTIDRPIAHPLVPLGFEYTLRRESISLLSRQAGPLYRLGFITGHPAAFGIHHTETVGCLSIAPCGRLTIPDDGLHFASWYPVAFNLP